MLDYLFSLSTKKDKIKLEQEESRMSPVDADLQIPDTSKFKNHTGWKPKYSFKRTIKNLLSYWRKKVEKDRMFINR